jgi:hypothetical protein
VSRVRIGEEVEEGVEGEGRIQRMREMGKSGVRVEGKAEAFDSVNKVPRG